MSRKPPSYRRHKASGQAVVTLNGRDHYLGPFNSQVSRTEYDRVVGEWMANGRQVQIEDEKSDLRICELVDRYLFFAENYYSNGGEPNSEFMSMQAVTKPLTGVYSRIKVVEFGPIALKTLREQWVQGGLAQLPQLGSWKFFWVFFLLPSLPGLSPGGLDVV